MELFLLLLQIKINPAARGFYSPGRPLLQDFPHAHHAWTTCHKNIEVAGKGILQSSHFEELLH